MFLSRGLNFGAVFPLGQLFGAAVSPPSFEYSLTVVFRSFSESGHGPGVYLPRAPGKALQYREVSDIAIPADRWEHKQRRRYPEVG